MRRVLGTIAALLAMISILLTVIFTVSFSRGFYRYEYRKGNQAEKIGMSDEGLMDATVTLLDYLEDRRDDIVVVTDVMGTEREVFDTRETLHMVDVKNLFQNAKTARNLMACVSLAILILLFFINRERYFTCLHDGWNSASLLMALFVAFVVIWCIADFNGFWMQFHYIFFDNDLFLLDPNVSIMINMFPESFFFDIVILIIMLFAAIFAAISGFLAFMKKKESAV